MVSKDVISISEHTTVHLLSVKILFANTENNNNRSLNI